MSSERLGQYCSSSLLLIVLSICFGSYTVAQSPQVQARQVQAPQVPASVASYPLQEPVGLQNLEARKASELVTSGTTTTAEPRVGSVGDYYQENSTGEFQVVEDSPVELSTEETVEILEEACEVIDGEKVCLPPSFTEYMLEPYSRYREDEAYTTYMPGDGDQFGWLTFGSNTWLNRGENAGMEMNFNLHLLSGPEAVALPPRLYDFELGYQSKTALSETFSYDLGLSVGIYSDFEDSAEMVFGSLLILWGWSILTRTGIGYLVLNTLIVMTSKCCRSSDLYGTIHLFQVCESKLYSHAHVSIYRYNKICGFTGQLDWVEDRGTLKCPMIPMTSLPIVTTKFSWGWKASAQTKSLVPGNSVSFSVGTLISAAAPTKLTLMKHLSSGTLRATSPRRNRRVST